MAFIAPLRGVRYNIDKVEHLEDVVTPPYDVINEDLVDDYVRKNPYSMIRLDITKSPGPEDITDSRYHEAASLFEQWLEDGVLVRDEKDCLYIYSVNYRHPSGRNLVRKGLVCLVGLAEFEEGVIKPHEQTFDSVISDRLKLTQYCKAQFSQIFSLYSDPDNTVMNSLETNQGEVIASVTDADGCRHTLRPVHDTGVIGEVQQFFKDRSLYIADGHHRYTTALAYRESIRAEKGKLAKDDPANHIMMYICPMEDPGLSVLSTHRLVDYPGRLLVADLLSRIEPFVDVEEVKGGTREVIVAEVLSRMDELEQSNSPGASTFGVYHAGEDRCFLVTLKNNAAEQLGSKPGELKELDVVILSELLIEKALELDHDRIEQENLVRYYPDPDEAMDVAVKEEALDEKMTPILFLMNPTRVKQVQAVADQNLIMPHKSTYFYPKIMTGLLFNQLVEGEKIARLD